MTEGWSVAILGATGEVGKALIALLQEREFPVGELHLLASERSAGEVARFNGKSYQIQNASEFDWSLAQLAFFVAGSQASIEHAESAAATGCLVIDTSGVFDFEPDVPLVVPSVNPHVLAEYRNRNIIALANSLCSQLLTAVKPIIESAGVSRLSVTNMVSASAQGKAAVDALAAESVRLLNGLPVEDYYFTKQLAFNVLPMLPDQQGEVMQERILVEQVRKVLQDDGLPISVCYVQVPVFYGHSQMVQVEGLRPISAEEAYSELSRCQEIQLSDTNEFPTPVNDASDNPYLSVGCLRNDYGQPEQLQFWSVADNVRFGGALMAIQTAEKLIQEYML